MARPTDQRSDVRPISFLLQRGGSFSAPVTLVIRPEELTRNEPTRATVHQTLGKNINGWVDNFGEGLPSVTIAGHTGWRAMPGTGMDGVQHFEQLNQLVVHDYSKAVQDAIDSGQNPASVKLIFCDMLDNFVWSVVPLQFQLRRSRSRPLLYQYNITLQAVSTSIDNPMKVLPNFGSIEAGVIALNGVVGVLSSVADNVERWVMAALVAEDRLLAPVATTVKRFVSLSTDIFLQVHRTVTAANNLITGTANNLVSIAGDIASVGVNVFRIVSALYSVPANIRAQLARIAAAYNEAVCIFRNSLRPREFYPAYTGLYGASNCSSTTGGRPPSVYVNRNIFELLAPERSPTDLDASARAGVAEIIGIDPVSETVSIVEIGRYLSAVNDGYSGVLAA